MYRMSIDKQLILYSCESLPSKLCVLFLGTILKRINISLAALFLESISNHRGSAFGDWGMRDVTIIGTCALQNLTNADLIMIDMIPEQFIRDKRFEINVNVTLFRQR